MKIIDKLCMILLLTAAFLLSGCDGFSDDSLIPDSTSLADNPEEIIISGRVIFPTYLSGDVAASISSIGKSGFGIKNSRISIYQGADVFFTKNLLQEQVGIYTDDNGFFAITRKELKKEFFTNQNEWKPFIVLAGFSGYELSALFACKKNITGSEILINPVSDGAVAFLKEEIIYKSAFPAYDASGNYDFSDHKKAEIIANYQASSWLSSLEDLALDFALQREEIQENFFLSDFNAADYESKTLLSQRGGGQKWGDNLLIQVKTNHQEWLDIYTKKELLCMQTALHENPVSLPERHLFRRQQQVLSAALELGFYAVDAGGNLLFKDKIQNLEQKNSGEAVSAPDLGLLTGRESFYINHNKALLEGIIPGLNAHLSIYPADYLTPTPNLAIFSLTELANFANRGKRYEEKVVTIAKNALKKPVITPEALKALSVIGTDQVTSLTNIIQIYCDFARQSRYSIERVRRDLSTGGQIVFGENVAPPAFLGGIYLNTAYSNAPDYFHYFWRNYQFSEHYTDDYESFLQQPAFYFSFLKDFYQISFNRLRWAGELITNAGNSYPNPITEAATHYMMYRKIDGQLKFSAEFLKREAEIMSYSLKFLADGILTADHKLDLTQRDITVALPFINLLAHLSFPFSGQQFFHDFSSPYKGKTPAVENIGQSYFPIDNSTNFWALLLTIPAATTANLVSLQNSIESLSITTIEHLSVALSKQESVELSGRILLGQENQQIIAAGLFPVFAQAGSTIYESQTDSDGYYTFPAVLGDSLYEIYVRIRDVLATSLDATNPRTLSFNYYVGGREGFLQLPDFQLDAQMALLSNNFVLRQRFESLNNLLQPINRAPEIVLMPMPALSSGIVPIDIILKDEDERLLDVHFSFVSGADLSVSTDSPRISTSSLINASFSGNGEINNLSSASNGLLTTLYWHTKQERGANGLLGDSSASNIQITLQVFANEKRVKGNTVISDFFNIDNEAPLLTITYPLKTIAPVETKTISIRGLAADSSKISTISVINMTHSSTISYYAIPTGNNYANWEIKDVSVKSGILNTLSFTAIDEFGNFNEQDITTSFPAHDSLPPLLSVTSVEVFSLCSSVLKNSYENIRYKSGDQFITISPIITANSIIYNLPARSEELEIPIVNTRSWRFTGTATDQNTINLIRMRNELNNFYTEASFQKEVLSDNSIIYNWQIDYTASASQTSNLKFFFSAIDQFQNDSDTQKTEWKEHRKSGVSLRITTIDELGPEAILLSPSTHRTPETITTNVVTLGGSAIDKSQIVSFVLCSPLLCQDVINKRQGFSEWEVTLPLAQKASNAITGFIADEYGFTTTYNVANAFKTYNLNDISSPSLSINAVDNMPITTIFVDGNFEISPRTNPAVFTASQCYADICSLAISGFAYDESGIGLVPDSSRENFNGFILRLNHLGFDAFEPTAPNSTKEQLYGDGTSIFPNQYNKTIITTHDYPAGVDSSGIQTAVSFTAQLLLEHDGYWPLWLRLTDNSNQIYRPFVRPSIDKREVFYVKKDTKAPEIKEVKLHGFEQSISNIFLIEIFAEDELSDIQELRIKNNEGVEFTISPNEFITQEPTSPWYKFIPVADKPELSAVKAMAWVTSEAGYLRQLTIYAQDIHGNEGFVIKEVDVVPVFLHTIRHEKDFVNPVQLRFGGDNYGSIFVLEAGLDRVEERTISPLPVVKKYIHGNQNESNFFYTQFTNGTGLDVFYERFADGTEDHSLLIHGNFGESSASLQHDEHELLYLNKEKIDYLYLGKFITPEDSIDSRVYHVFRDNVYAGEGEALPPNSVFRFTPKLKNVVYVFKEDLSGVAQLSRFVNGFRQLSGPLMASQGGNPASTGVYGISTPALSEVKTIAVTQIHIEGSAYPVDGVVCSEEWIYLAQQNPHRISRFHYVNLQENMGGGFRSLDPIRLNLTDTEGVAVSGLSTSIVPTAMTIEDDGSFIYIGNASDHKIYKISLLSEPPVLISSFGGHGIGAGHFLSIDDISGYRVRSQKYLQRLYVIDQGSKAISIWSSDGDFINFYGRNDYTIGGMVNPSLIGSGGLGLGSDGYDGSWHILDQALGSLTFYNEDDFHNKRFWATDLGLSKFINPQAFLLSKPYLTGSTMIRKLFLYDSGFDDSGILEFDWLEDENKIVAKGGISPKNPFSGLKQVALVQDQRTGHNDVVGILTLENLTANTDRIQWYANDLRTAKQSIEVNVHSSASHICDFGTGLILIAPDSTLTWHKYPTGVRFLSPTASFQTVQLTGFLGEYLELQAPQSVACNEQNIFVADKNKILSFEVPNIYDGEYQSRLQQEIVVAEPNTESLFSDQLSIMLRDNYLYVLEKEKRLVRKFQIK